MKNPSPWADAGPRRCWMPPEEFAQQLEESGRGFLMAVEGLQQHAPESWSEGSLSNLTREALTLEGFLDVHGAKANQAFFPLRKSVACVLWLSEALSCLVHLRGRLEVYPSADEFWTQRSLPEGLENTVKGLGGYLIRTTQVLKQQWLTAGCTWSVSAPDSPQPPIKQSKILVADRAISGELSGDSDANSSIPAARLANRYLGFFHSWATEAAHAPENPQDLIRFLEEFCKERTVRSFKARAHNWQSDYDSLVLGTNDERECVSLGCLRGAISQVLHLLEAMVALSHLFERHRPGLATDSGDPTSSFWEAKEFLELFVVGCVQTAYRSLEVGVDSAKLILSDFTKETYIYVKLAEGVHLHARPLSLLVRLTLHYGLPISMSADGNSASTDSLIKLLLLSGQHPDSREFRFDGDAGVLEDIALLFEANLGEDGIESLPDKLSYLRQ